MSETFDKVLGGSKPVAWDGLSPERPAAHKAREVCDSSGPDCDDHSWHPPHPTGPVCLEEPPERAPVDADLRRLDALAATAYSHFHMFYALVLEQEVVLARDRAVLAAAHLSVVAAQAAITAHLEGPP